MGCPDMISEASLNIHSHHTSKNDARLRSERATLRNGGKAVDVYFSADVETDGPIPGPYSMLSFALVYAGAYDGKEFVRPSGYDHIFYREMRPISDMFQAEAMAVNGLDRNRLLIDGSDPSSAMRDASDWLVDMAGGANAVLVAFPLSFDWSWLYWYFTQFSETGSPFGHSNCFDIKTAFAVKSRNTIGRSGRSRIPPDLTSRHAHTHHAIDDAIEQAEIFANIFEWDGGR